MENKKVKITGSLIKVDETHYKAVWLTDETRHIRAFTAKDGKEAKEKFDKVMETVKKHYNKD